MSEQKKQEEQKPQEQPMRKIHIETNGNYAKIVKCETAGALELKAILQGLIGTIK